MRLNWRDADPRRTKQHLYVGNLYVARIKALRPGEWWYVLASPDIAQENHGTWPDPDQARRAAEKAVLRAMGLESLDGSVELS